MENFTKVYKRLLQIDFFGNSGPALPDIGVIADKISRGKILLPNIYIERYVKPLEASLVRLLELYSQGKLPADVVETVCAAVYLHLDEYTLAPPMRRFLAVNSNLFRSFLDAAKREAKGIPITDMWPPLAMFKHSGALGPFAVTAEETYSLIGSTVGVVSLPATCANDPIIWGILAHETGGHIISHANPGLIAQLNMNVPLAIAGMAASPGLPREMLSLLWSYWLDEVVADVYGILNMGPLFMVNMALFFSAASARGAPIEPKLRMKSGHGAGDLGQALDPHPTDILRLYVGMGVIETLVDLAPEVRVAYITLLEDLALFLAKGESISIDGSIALSRDHRVPINATVPLSVMQESAKNMGRMIGTVRLEALGNCSIQEIETWDDADEARAQAVSTAVLEGKPIGALGDDAQLLAGVTLALMKDPTQYDAATVLLNNGLDNSYDVDPIFGKLKLHQLFNNLPER